MIWPGIERMPRLYAALTSGFERALAPTRAALLGGLRGVVFEVGAGTGANLRHISAGAEHLVSDITPAHLHYLKRLAPHTRLLGADAAHLPVADNSVDHIVATLVLCSVTVQERVIDECARALKAGGKLHLIEHTLSGHQPIDTMLHAIEKPWGFATGGCHPNRATDRVLEAAGWRLERHERRAGGVLRIIVASPP